MGESTATPESTAAYRGAARGFREARQELLESYQEELDKSLPALPYWRERLNSRWETVEPAEVSEAMRRLLIDSLVGEIRYHLRRQMSELYDLNLCSEAEYSFDVSVQISLPRIPRSQVADFWRDTDVTIWIKEDARWWSGQLKEGLQGSVDEHHIPPFTGIEVEVSDRGDDLVATVKVSFDSPLHWPVVSST